MAFSKITLNGTTLMDVTGDTVVANHLLDGDTATGSNGVQLLGTLQVDVVVDPTLSNTGEAADAKVTGDSISDMKKAIIANTNYSSMIDTAYQGGFSGAAQDGTITNMSINTNANRIRTFDGTTGLPVQGKINKMIRLYPGFTYRISVNSGYKYAIQAWNSSGVGTMVYGFTTEPTTIIPTVELYLGCMLALSTDANLTPSAISNMTLEIVNDIKKAVPPAPTANGTYTLRCVVSSGTPTYSWVSA